MCMVMVWEMLVYGILVGIIGLCCWSAWFPPSKASNDRLLMQTAPVCCQNRRAQLLSKNKKAPRTVYNHSESLNYGAANRDRTGTVLPPRDFKSLASASSAMAADNSYVL